MIHPTTMGILGPHQKIEARDQREQFALVLFDLLWDRYRNRVSYVAEYERVIEETGATFVNDHVAFRTFAANEPSTGIASLSRIFEAIGFRLAGSYHFPDKHLNAVHYWHRNPCFPKIFISELKTWELGSEVREVISETMATHREPVSDDTLARLASVQHVREQQQPELMQSILSYFHDLPWVPPTKDAVRTAHEASQYAAWVMVHGYNVNHFTSLVNSHGIDQLNTIGKTIDALRNTGVPMKKEVEGPPKSKLRQSATEAVVIDVDVRDGEGLVTMPWTYAYFELAERNEVIDPETGKSRRFEGFLGPQATNLFEMTRRS